MSSSTADASASIERAHAYTVRDRLTEQIASTPNGPTASVLYEPTLLSAEAFDIITSQVERVKWKLDLVIRTYWGSPAAEIRLTLREEQPVALPPLLPSYKERRRLERRHYIWP